MPADQTKNVVVLAISGKTKVALFSGLTHQVAQGIRHDLVRSLENFDMLGNEICRYRLKKVK